MVSKKVKRLGRSARRKFGKRTFRIKKGQVIHYFKRLLKREYTVTNAGFVAISSNPAPRYNNWRLDDLNGYTDFTNLYDSYKICGIKNKFVFNKNSSDAGVSTAGYELPMLITVNDFNDTTALTSEAQAMEYATFKAVRLDKPVSRYFRPSQIQQTDAGVNNDLVVKSRWNSTERPDITMAGLKVAVDTINSAGGTTIGTLCVYTTYYVACRTPK